MCNGVDVAAGPTYVAFDKFCSGYAFVAVGVHPCPRALGHTQNANNDNKKTAPKDRLEVLIVFLLFSKSILATDCQHFPRSVFRCNREDSPHRAQANPLECASKIQLGTRDEFNNREEDRGSQCALKMPVTEPLMLGTLGERMPFG
jgi:hypothetical protein